VWARAHDDDALRWLRKAIARAFTAS
jgi:hypothetical protein